jgi:ATP-dependent Clp protease protease subunit
MALPSTELGIGYDIFRVVAGFDSTEVFVDGQSRRMLMAGEYTAGKNFEELSADMERDFFMSAEEAVAYGLADKIINKRD